MIGVAKFMGIQSLQEEPTVLSLDSDPVIASAPPLPPEDASTPQDEFTAEYVKDHPLDYYTPCPLERHVDMHSCKAFAPPLNAVNEMMVKLKLDSLPLGLRLDATAAEGQDGCRVLQVLSGGAAEHVGLLGPDDYVTRINSNSLRAISNMRAFQILHHCATKCHFLEVSYFPACKVLEHRMKYLKDNSPITPDASVHEEDITPQKPGPVENTPLVGFVTPIIDQQVAASSLTPVGDSDVLEDVLVPYAVTISFASGDGNTVGWEETREVELYRTPSESCWGLKLTSPELWRSVARDALLPLPLGVSSPTFVYEAMPLTAAGRCGRLNHGDIIVGVNGMDTSGVGAARTLEYIQAASKGQEPGARLGGVPLYLLVLSPYHTNAHVVAVDVESPPASDLGLQSPVLVNGFRGDALPSSSIPVESLRAEDDTDRPAGPIIHLLCPSSGESSMMEEPETVENLDISDDLTVPQSVSSLDPSISAPPSGALTTDGETGSSWPAKVAPVPPRRMRAEALQLNGDSNVVDALSAGHSSEPPAEAPRKIMHAGGSFAWRQLGSRLSSSDSHSDDLESANLVQEYTRPDVPGDKVVIVDLDLQPPSPRPSSASTLSQLNPDTETLGIRLVGHREPTMRATFIAGIRENSRAALCGNFRVADEIVQVNNVCLLGFAHLSTKLIIAKEAEAVRRGLKRARDSSTAILRPLCPSTELRFVLRRNSNYNNKTMACANIPPDTQLHLVERRQSQYSSSELVNPHSSADIHELSPVSTKNPSSHPTTSPVEMNYVDVTLERGKTGFGLCLVNLGRNRELGIFVQSITADSSADKTGKIKLYDQIVAINGQSCKDYDWALQMMMQSSGTVHLRLARVVSHLSSGPLTSLPTLAATEPIIPGVENVIELVKDDGGLGFSIVGGIDTLLGSIYIHEVHKSGIAAQDGRLWAGDRLLAVNNFDLRNADHATATNIIRATEKVVLLRVLRDPRRLSEADVFETLTIRFDKRAHHGYGFTVVSAPNSTTGAAIGEIIKGSQAHRLGSLKVGDVIIQVNGRDVRSCDSDVITAMLKAEKQIVLKVGRSKVPSLLHEPMPSAARLRQFSVILCRDRARQRAADVDVAGPGTSSVFGMVLRSTTEAERACAPGCLLIQSLVPDGPATRSGMIQAGDRLLAIDREPVDWLSVAEVTNFADALDSASFEFGRLPLLKYISTTDAVGDMPTCNAGMAAIAEEGGHGDSQALMENGESETVDLIGSCVQVLQLYLPFSGLPPSVGWVNNGLPTPQLGIELIAAPGASGPKVSRVQPGSPGHEAGLQVGDRLLGLDDHLLIAIAGVNTEKVLIAIHEAWLRRYEGNPVCLTVISSRPRRQHSSASNHTGSRTLRNTGGAHLPDTNFAPGNPSLGSLVPGLLKQSSRSMGLPMRQQLRRWPKDVGDNMDVNLQAAPPGFLTAMSAGVVIGSVWSTPRQHTEMTAFEMPDLGAETARLQSPDFRESSSRSPKLSEEEFSHDPCTDDPDNVDEKCEMPYARSTTSDAASCNDQDFADDIPYTDTNGHTVEGLEFSDSVAFPIESNTGYD